MTSRQVAFGLLKKVQLKGAYSNIALDTVLKNSTLSSRDKAFCTAIFYGVLERKITLNEIIAKLTNSKKLDTDVAIALQMGLYQIIFMNSVPDSAAVNESVMLLKSKSQKGFVNGVLRAYLRGGENIFDALPINIKYSCPKWLYEKWVNDYGSARAEEIMKSSIGSAPTVCRVNTVKISADELIERLAQENINAVKTDTDNALILSNASVSESKAYVSGWFHIEDISAQNACFVLAPEDNETVFDLCAAPGGKTFTMAELMNNKGRILAFDLHEKRAGLIEKGAKRLGLDIITAKTGNAAVYNKDLGKADRVLCDVPCSGLGIIRRKPEIKYKDSAEFDRLPEIQLNILSNGSKYVKAGGVLVYSTCTLSKAENEDVVEKFLRAHPDFLLTYSETTFPSNLRDGFYIAKFERTK